MIILPGKMYGELKPISITKVKGEFHWNCLCTCGKLVCVREAHLHQGRQETCGRCEYRLNHPLAYKSYDSMKQRCLNSNAPDYPRYGGRGITISQEWRTKFMNFFRDMGDPPVYNGERYTLNRKDNDGPYCKENCEWANRFAQQTNRRDTLPAWKGFYRSGNVRKFTT